MDYSTLGNIDPDIIFLTEMNTMLCNYYTEFEFNQCSPNINKFSIFNLKVRSLPKTSIKFVISWKDCNTIFLFYLSPRLGFVTTIDNCIGYSHVHKLRCKNKVGGGVSMFINSIINLYLERI